MEALDYRLVRDRMVESLVGTGLRVTVEEAVFLNSLSKGCDIFVYPAVTGPDVWAKIGFEWLAANQALFEQIEQDGELAGAAPEETGQIEEDATQVLMHCEFHLHFSALAMATEVMRDVATGIKKHAELYFGDDGGVVAEVFLSSDEAKLDCLRYEINSAVPMVTDQPWWNRWSEVARGMLDKLADLYVQLENEFGPSRN